MRSFLISVLGDDKPGLVDGLSKIILSSDGDWIESRMSSFEGKFAGILKVNVPYQQHEHHKCFHFSIAKVSAY